MISKELIKRKISTQAKELGFLDIRFAKAEFMEPEAKRLEQWLSEKRNGQMSYLENHFDKRLDPTLLVPGAKTVISLSFNYFNPESQKDESAPKIAKYAYGKDYHKFIKKKLHRLLNYINEEVGEVSGRAFVDSAPVLERDWAKRAGLGWIGKHTLLLTKGVGSYFFLAELIIDLELEYDTPVSEHCGSCRKCIDACPTEAIDEQGLVMDGSKCISYLTIELKDAMPKEFDGKMDNWMFGCDVCQQVCPWNRFATPHTEERLNPHPDLLGMEKKDWQNLEESIFEKLFSGSAVRRTKYLGLKRNIAFLKEK